VKLVVFEGVKMVAEVVIDFDGPSGFLKARDGIGTEPRPVDGGGGEVRLGEPGTLGGGGLAGLLFGKGEEEAVGGVGVEVGEAELGEELKGAKFSGFVAGDGAFGGGLDEGELVLSVADGGAGDEPGVPLGGFHRLEEKLGDAGGGGFLGEGEVEGGLEGGFGLWRRSWAGFC